MFELLAHILDTCNPRNCYLPLAVIWVLAMNPTTLARIPTLKLVPAMIRATIANCGILKATAEEAEAKAEAEQRAKAAGGDGGASLDTSIDVEEEAGEEEDKEDASAESDGEEDDELETQLAELEQALPRTRPREHAPAPPTVCPDDGKARKSPRRPTSAARPPVG